MTASKPYKSTDWRVADVSACTLNNLRKAARAVGQIYDASLMPTGLKGTQFILLAHLNSLGPLPLTQLADAMVMDRTTLTRNLKPLIEQKLVATAPGEDRRVRTIVLTKQGQAKVKEALPHWRKIQKRLVDDIGTKRWSGLLNNLSATVKAAQQQ